MRVSGGVVHNERRDRVRIMITSPLEEDHVRRIEAAYPDQIELIFRPDLLPPARYIADHDGDPSWSRSARQETEWHALLATADVFWDFPRGDSRNPRRYAPKLKWVQTTSAGVGQLVHRLGIQPDELIVTTASGIHAQPLAEFVIGSLLYHVRRFDRLLADQQDHRWERHCTRSLAGMTMAIIGPGRIGREVARVARAFGMRVLAMARSGGIDRAGDLGVDRTFGRHELHDMLSQADCLVLSTPHTPETERMIGAVELSAMKPGSTLVNIARGAIVDEAALIQALERGQLAFAALDVFQDEPLPADSPLWELPNVLISPHSASTVDTENARIVDLFIRNLGHYLDGDTASMSPRLDIRRLY